MGGGGGGGCCQVQRGPAPGLRISRKKGSFLKPPPDSPRFVKEGYFSVPWYKVWGENPHTIHEISAALTPSDSRSDWTSGSAAAKQADDYKI